jgi:rubrerythrin
MGIFYTAEEIYEIGLGIERNGKTFYEAAADTTTQGMVRDLFGNLGKWETGHIELLMRLKAGLPKTACEPRAFDPENELPLYLKAASDSHIFKAGADIVGLVSRCKTAMDALSMALVFEKDSVVLYSTFFNLVPADSGRTDVERILQEELKHVVYITNEMKKLTE